MVALVNRVVGWGVIIKRIALIDRGIAVFGFDNVHLIGVDFPCFARQTCFAVCVSARFDFAPQQNGVALFEHFMDGKRKICREQHIKPISSFARLVGFFVFPLLAYRKADFGCGCAIGEITQVGVCAKIAK